MESALQLDANGPARLSVIVPVKDEVESIELLSKELAAALDSAHDPRVRNWELIFVDDGSSDESWSEISRLAATDLRIRGLKLRRNYGKSAALAAGVRACEGEVIVTMDGDLQDDPAEIPGMVARLGEGADLVAGFKESRQDPLGKRLPSKVFNAFTSLVTGLRLKDHNCGLKAGRREVFEKAPLYGEMHRYFAAISHANGFRVVELPVHHRPRQFGKSKFGLERYARGGLDLMTVLGLTRYANRPAHLFGGVGLILGLAGSAILTYLSGIWLFTDQAIGNRPLLLLGALMVLVAVQLVSLGVLAEMLVRREVDRTDPLNIVAERANL